MKYYEKIHIWNFPTSLTFIRLDEEFRKKLIDKAISRFGNEATLVQYINNKGSSLDINRKYSRGSFYMWKKGYSVYRERKVTINMPLWVLIETTKMLSGSDKEDNIVMRRSEKKIQYYCSRGFAQKIYNPKLPIRLNPEFVSIIFHFCGDGHLALRQGISSSYRQMNEETLRMVYEKLKNCFGDFRLSLDKGKLYIPRIISDLYSYYFDIKQNKWNNSRIPEAIMKMDKEFLLAGLVSFIIDEGSVGEVMEIYSKNLGLLGDIRKCAVRCGYNCKEIRKKFRYGFFDSYRFSISSTSYLKLHRDILDLTSKFPLCTFAHKAEKFEIVIKRKKNPTKFEEGVTKKNIIEILAKGSKTLSELVQILNIGNSAVREHLWGLEREKKIIREGRKGRNILWKAI